MRRRGRSVLAGGRQGIRREKPGSVRSVSLFFHSVPSLSLKETLSC